VFTPHHVEGAKFTSTTSKKYGLQSQHEEACHLDSDMVDLAAMKEHKIMEQVVKEKDNGIAKLRDSLSKANFMISFLEHENQQLNVK